ncbi:MAG: type pilus assembly protein PilM [Actinomycetota bacterium]|nr:type pilus assembly protein PilM [Actinomycetota bacterium]
MAGRTAIGLDVGTSVVRAVELSFGRGGITLERFGQVVLPDGAVRDGQVVDPVPVAASLRQLWSATGLSHKRVVLGVANQQVIVRKVDLPAMDPAELRRSLPFLVADILPMDVGQSVLDFFPLEEATDEEGAPILRGLLVAASRETVLANVTCVEQAGMSVQAVDLTSFAVLRALGKQTGPDVDTEALIDIGARITNIVVHRGGVPIFVRILLMGGQDVTDALAEWLDVPPTRAEALKQQIAQSGGVGSAKDLDQLLVAVTGQTQDFVDEVSGSLDYFAASNPGVRLQRILLSGGGSRLEGLRDRLAAETRLPVLAGDPMANLRIGRTGLDPAQLDFVRPLAAVPVGLALGAFG